MKCFLTVLQKPLQSNLLLVMKLTALLTLFFTLNVSANGFGQDKINLRVKKTEIGGVLRSIENQTNYRFLYNNELQDIREKISLTVNNAPLAEVLSLVFFKTNLYYQVMDNNLIIIKEDAAAAPVDVTIRGKVTGEGGVALAGVSILVKGSTIGTTTNNEGNFSLNVPNADVTLVFSSVGYDDQEVALNGKTEISVALVTSTKLIDQVVVIGYGTANKRDLTGSIVKISGKEVADKPNTNPISSLQSKVAGLSVVNNGTPGKTPDIRIRGTVSIGQVHPLYVVDGIFNDNIDYINPNDIESIEILKDPSSLAIFGVKGATGVIAITTKRAKAGKVVVNFNTNYGFKKLVDKIKLASADEFAILFAEERANNGNTTPFNYTNMTSNTDWLDVVTRTGQFNNNNISVSSSTDKNKFNLGVGYVSDQGIIRHEKLEKWLLSFSDELKLNKAFKVGINLNASRLNNPYDANWVLDEARKPIPQISANTQRFFVKNPYGTDSLNMDIYSRLDEGLQSSGVINPLLRLENEWDKTINIEYRTVGSIYGDLTFLKYFNLRATLYADMSTVDKVTYAPLYYGYAPRTNIPTLYNTTTSVQQNIDRYKKFQQDYILNYKRTFGDHGITATGGFTTYYSGVFIRQTKVTQGSGPTAKPIPDDERFWYINNGFVGTPGQELIGFNQSGQNEYSTVSYLARILYNYKSRYFLNASFRDDASSRLPEANRNQQFWAVGAAWEVSKEDFFQNSKFIDFLKIKGSVGVLGNQTASRLDGTPLNYPFYPNLLTGSNAIFGTNIYTAADPEYIPNPDLKWETVNAWEAGFEANAFDNRLHIEANYFNRTTNDLMTYVDRGPIGLKNKLVNGGSIRNWGEEISATWNQNFSSDLSVNIGGNITFLKNKVLSLSEELPTGVLSRRFQNNGTAESRTTVGQPIGYFYGYIVEGIYQSYADILASPIASSIGAYRPGDFKFKDINGPLGKGPDGLITADDKTLIGNPTPDFSYGASVNVTYKRLTLSVDMGGVYGNDVFRTWGSLESPFQRVNYSADKINRWHGPGTSNWVPLVSQEDRFNYNGSTYNIEDGSYFRLRNIQLGYSFNKSLISKWKIGELRVYANVQNLKTWKNNYGYSPEFGGDATAFGYDNADSQSAIPMVTTFGLNVTF